jgi:hypothetical protein
MDSPRIKEAVIPRLDVIAKQLKQPMPTFANEIIADAVVHDDDPLFANDLTIQEVRQCTVNAVVEPYEGRWRFVTANGPTGRGAWQWSPPLIGTGYAVMPVTSWSAAIAVGIRRAATVTRASRSMTSPTSSPNEGSLRRPQAAEVLVLSTMGCEMG